VNYAEGATVGYKWFDARGLKPLFAFGHGLSYTRFTYSNLQARLDGQDLVVKFQVRNTGRRDGKDVAQVYVSPMAGGLGSAETARGLQEVELQPGCHRARGTARGSAPAGSVHRERQDLAHRTRQLQADARTFFGGPAARNRDRLAGADIAGAPKS
jgi:hypothetical protein